MPAPKITAVVDADFSNPLNPIYREISVSLSEDVVAKAELKFSSKGKGTGKIYLGHVSAYLGEGFYADVVFYLNISADGKVTIQYTLSNTLTASYINGDFRMNASCNGSWDGTQAEVNGQLLGEPQVNLRFLGCWFDNKLYGAIDIIGVQADAGAKLKATATVHDKKPKLCTNLDLYSYVSVGVNTDMGILGNTVIEFVLCREKPAYPLAYVREAEGEKVLVIINPSDKEQSFPYSAELKDALYTIGGKAESKDGTITIPAQSAGFYHI